MRRARTIGVKMGTGGSPGARYLATTLAKPAFPDLWEIRGAASSGPRPSLEQE